MPSGLWRISDPFAWLSCEVRARICSAVPWPRNARLAEALGKVDEYGQVTEDLRGQILGQLSERLSYDKLYQDAVRDPTLQRTRQELEVAMQNARTARDVVFELFQDLEGFRLDDYRQFDDGGAGMDRLVRYLREGVSHRGGKFTPVRDDVYEVTLNGDGAVRVRTSRERAKADDDLALLGLENPLVRRLMADHSGLSARERGLTGRWSGAEEDRGVLTAWRVEIHGAKGHYHRRIVTIGLNDGGERCRHLERKVNEMRGLQPCESGHYSPAQRLSLAGGVLPEMLRRDLADAGCLPEGASFSARLLAWIEVA